MFWFKVRLFLNQVKVFCEETAVFFRDRLFRQKLSVPPDRRRILTIAAVLLFSVILVFSVLGFFTGIPLRGMKPGDCIVDFDGTQIERFKRSALRLDRLPDLDVSLHVVQNKEDFWRIAKSNRINLDTIIGANPWLPDLLARRGQEILLLSRRGVLHVVRRGENVAGVAELYRIPAGEIRRSNRLFIFGGIRPGTVLFIPDAAPKLMTQKIYDYSLKRKIFISPTSGKYTQRFGWREHPFTHQRNFHKGLDIRARYGSLVWAAADGVVIAAGPAAGYGNVVIIQHKDGFTTLYAHNSVILVSTGRKVHKGQPIARAGNSGLSTGTHVHFEVRKNGKPDDPATYLW
jgi:hypothetical protein